MARTASNIDNQGVTFRLRRSVYAFAAALVAIAALRITQTPIVWFAVAAVPFFTAFLMTYQGLFRT